MSHLLVPVAILSTTVLPLDGLYAVVGSQTVGPLTAGCQVDVPQALALHLDNFAQGQPTVCEVRFEGVPHYVGHPATKALLEAWGASQACTCGHAKGVHDRAGAACEACAQEEGLACANFEAGKLFPGLAVGECCLCIPIVQGQSDRTGGGSAIHQEVTVEQVEVRIVLRVA